MNEMPDTYTYFVIGYLGLWAIAMMGLLWLVQKIKKLESKS